MFLITDLFNFSYPLEKALLFLDLSSVGSAGSPAMALRQSVEGGRSSNNSKAGANNNRNNKQQIEENNRNLLLDSLPDEQIWD
jgi:phage-related minor tail protein